MRLHIYFARKFLRSFLLVFGVFLGITLLIDMVEQIRRYSGESFGLPQAFELSLINAPANLYRIMPLVVILATLALFLGLSRTSEMVVTRASGRSALRSLVSPVLTAMALGVLAVTVFNPIVAATAKRYEVLSNRYSSNTASVLSLNEEGLWLRQGSRDGQTVIHAVRANLDGTELYDVSFLAFDDESGPISRIEAASARLEADGWQLRDAKRWWLAGETNPERSAERLDSLTVPSDLTRDSIRESFGTPSAIPIWDLPAFIARMEEAGFSALQHRVWFWMEIAQPLMLAAMVLIGAGFTMRHTRFGRTGLMILMALIFGFGVFFLKNFAQVLGENGQIPVLLAAWIPPLAGVLMSLGLLFHTEDG